MQLPSSNPKISKELNLLIDPYCRSTTSRLQSLFRHPLFTPRYNISLEEERRLALERLQSVCSLKIVSVMDFEHNPLNIFAVHEALGMVDGSAATKFTVQFNLFGGTLLKLANSQQREMVKDIDSLKAIGCFALTELGYGNNAVEMETIAEFVQVRNKDKQEGWLIIDTPSTLAQKYWITNSAMHAQWAIVFAQLKIKGQMQGVHAILVPIRDPKTHQPMPGVTIQDMGIKMGCNGVDNGKLWFKGVKVPARNLLSRHSTLTEDGQFNSSIEKLRDRFLIVADQLLSGRLCIASMMLGGLKVCLTIAMMYSSTRMAVGQDGKSSAPIISFQLQQQALFPLIATSFACFFGLNHVKQLYSNHQLGKNQSEDGTSKKEVLRLCCVIKPLITWHAERVASICRERCGGQGYLMVNQFSQYIEFAHSGMTAEGDNAVLMQKVAKELLPLVGDHVKFVMNTPITFNNINDITLLLQHRSSSLLITLAKIMSKSQDTYSVWMHQQSALIQDTARAYGELMCWRQFIRAIESAQSESAKHVLSVMARIHGLTLIYRDLAFYIMSNTLNNPESISPSLHAAITEFAPLSMTAIDAFGIPDHIIKAPIARDWTKYNEGDNQGEHYRGWLRSKI